MTEEVLQQVQRFFECATRKVGLHFRNSTSQYFQEHEIWWASLGENVGVEINGKNHRFERPVVVVRKFSNEMLAVVPSTSKLKDGDWFFPYTHDGRELRAVIAQMRTISSKRLIRKTGHMTPEDFAAMKFQIRTLYKI